MKIHCPSCGHEWHVGGHRSAKLGAILGGIAGLTTGRRLRGAVLGSLVGYALGRLFGDNDTGKCPCCGGPIEKSDDSDKAEDA
jgi:hypothetical protein